MNQLPIRTVPACRTYRWLLAIPFIWQAALAPAINNVAWTPFGMPFPMLWQMTGVVLTSAVIALVFRLDRAEGIEREEVAFIAETSAAQTTEDTQ
jgi:Protein of unknown function (DUF3311)